jgi:hypothetical protein
MFLLPVSTVASESAFSTGGRILDSFRSCLSPEMAEALICTQNWLLPSMNHFKDHYTQEDLDASEKVVRGNNIKFKLTSECVFRCMMNFIKCF